MKKEKVYCGRRRPMEAGPAEVWVGGRPLNLERSLKVRRHSPDGFQWGYSGSGPAQLALALLLDCLGSVKAAHEWYQQFKSQVIAGLGDQWVMTESDIRTWYAHARRDADEESEQLNNERTENAEKTDDRDNSAGDGPAASEGEAAGGGIPVLATPEDWPVEQDDGLFDV